MSSNPILRVPFKVRQDASGKEFLSVQLTLLLQNPNLPHATRYAKCIVDSGAVFCVFDASFAKHLDLDIRAGERSIATGIGGSWPLWLHDIYRLPDFSG